MRKNRAHARDAVVRQAAMAEGAHEAGRKNDSSPQPSHPPSADLLRRTAGSKPSARVAGRHRRLADSRVRRCGQCRTQIQCIIPLQLCQQPGRRKTVNASMLTFYKHVASTEF